MVAHEAFHIVGLTVGSFGKGETELVVVCEFVTVLSQLGVGEVDSHAFKLNEVVHQSCSVRVDFSDGDSGRINRSATFGNIAEGYVCHFGDYRTCDSVKLGTVSVGVVAGNTVEKQEDVVLSDIHVATIVVNDSHGSLHGERVSQITEVNKLLKRKQGVEVSVESSNGAALAIHNSDSLNYSGVGDGESPGVESAFGGGIVTIGGVVDLSTVGSGDFHHVVGSHLNYGSGGTSSGICIAVVADGVNLHETVVGGVACAFKYQTIVFVSSGFGDGECYIFLGFLSRSHVIFSCDGSLRSCEIVGRRER